MTYQPETDPRFLPPISAEDRDAYAGLLAVELEQMYQQRDALSAVIGMFSSRGWKITQDDIRLEMQVAQGALTNPATPVDKVEFIRGELFMLDKLLSMGQRAVMRLDGIKARIREAEEHQSALE